MLYTVNQKKQVRELRQSGNSLNEIVLKMGIPKSTLRGWISDIKLTPIQKRKLRSRSFIALQKGRKRSQESFKKTRVQKEKELLQKGKKEIGKLTNRELFIAGIALYWAEGFKNKHEKRLGFCNSDPNMILFYLFWLQKSLGVDKNQITARLTINDAYKDREQKIREYWSLITSLPLSSFTKTFYQHAANKKKYNNKNSYHGILRLHVKESLDYLLKMRGWIKGIAA